MRASPHLHFKGNCREAFDFYAATFRGRIAFAMTYGESPAASQSPPQVRDQIIHARLEFGNQAIMGCDAPGERFDTPQGFNVLLTVEEPEEAERVFGLWRARAASACRSRRPSGLTASACVRIASGFRGW